MANNKSTDLEELADYFNEHIRYELRMVRYTRQLLEIGYVEGGPLTSWEYQMRWNTAFAAFNVSARNLYHFMTNRDGTNALNSDFNAHRRSQKTPKLQSVLPTLKLLNHQCLHLGPERPKQSDKKMSIDMVLDVCDWTIKNMKALVDSFNEDFSAKLCSDWKELLTPLQRLSIGPEGPTSSSHPLMMSTGPTGTGDLKIIEHGQEAQ